MNYCRSRRRRTGGAVELDSDERQKNPCERLALRGASLSLGVGTSERMMTCTQELRSTGTLLHLGGMASSELGAIPQRAIYQARRINTRLCLTRKKLHPALPLYLRLVHDKHGPILHCRSVFPIYTGVAVGLRSEFQ